MQERFQFLGKNPMRILNKGNFLASFTVTDTEIGIEFRDVRLLKGKNGLFVAAPARAYEDKDGQTQYMDYWRVAYDSDNKERDTNGMDYVDAMTAAAKAFYESISQDAGAAPAKRSGASASRTATRGGRGPIPAKAKAEAPEVGGGKTDEDDDLPF